VNVSARLQTLAEPGEICISASVREHVGEKLPIGFVDIGEHVVKNIARPVHVYRGAKRGYAAAEDPEKPPLALPDRPSIAVLAFTNMSDDAEHEYFADGMVEDIITGLSRIRWLFVIARNSSFTYKGHAVDIKQVGRELGVRYVLEGSVRKAGDRVRITAQLIEANSGRHIFAERYDRAVDDIFALQDDITISVVAAIEPSLRQAEILRVKRKRPDNLDAYDLVLRAMPFSETGMPDGALRALPLLEHALTLEPDYALAHGHAAWCHENLFVRAGRHDENCLGAIRHGHTAIAHGRDDATALTLGGVAIGMVEHDRLVAQEAFEAALSLSPSSAYAYTFGGLVMGWGGEAERAIEWGERAVRLSPFDAWAFAAWHAIFLGHFLRGRFEEAVDATRKGIRCKPGFSVSYMMLAAPLAKLGRIDEAKSAAARLLALQPSFSISGHCVAVGAVPPLTAALTEALRSVGLPD
jgi:adenylate cyclase